MHLERRVLGKFGPAVRALKRLRTRVCSLVHHQRRLGAERFTAP